MWMTGGFVRYDAHAGHARELRPQLLDDLIRRQRALVARLQIDLQAAAVRRRPPTFAVTRRRRSDRLRRTSMTCAWCADHRLEADALHRLDLPVELAGVLARNEALRDDPEAVDGADAAAAPTPPSSTP